jgi:E3 ubiquitin-protein ligase RAD18
MLKDTALRKKMSELGLSSAGSRPMLEKRHQEWVTIWNANCDSARPKKRSELMHDLEVWERTMGSRAPTMSRAANMGAQIKDKDFDGAAWATTHGTSFKDLIARARSSRDKVAQKVDGPSKTEEPGSTEDGGKGVNDTVLVPGASKAAVVDLTGPPSSQPEPGSPTPRAGGLPSAGDVGFMGDSGSFLGKGLLYPPADSIPTCSPSLESEGAPS